MKNKLINTHMHSAKIATYKTTRMTNDTRRTAHELELAGNTVQHTPAASQLYRVVSSALSPSIGQARQTHLVFRSNFYYTSKHKYIDIIISSIIIIYIIVRVYAHCTLHTYTTRTHMMTKTNVRKSSVLLTALYVHNNNSNNTI